jgi:hypothetical protein
MAYNTRVIAFEFGPTETTAATTTTIGTIDGTSLRGITQNYGADVEIHAARYRAGGGYSGGASNMSCVVRATGNVECYNGTAVCFGDGVTNVLLTASTTDILVQVTTDDVNSMTHYVWLIFRVNGEIP